MDTLVPVSVRDRVSALVAVLFPLPATLRPTFGARGAVFDLSLAFLSDQPARSKQDAGSGIATQLQVVAQVTMLGFVKNISCRR
jgi:hypothetical protein